MADYRIVVRPAGDTETKYHDDTITANTVALAKQNSAVTGAITTAKAAHPGVPIITKTYEEHTASPDTLEDTATDANAIASEIAFHNATTKAAVTSIALGEITAEQDEAEIDVGYPLVLYATNLEKAIDTTAGKTAGTDTNFRAITFTSDNANVRAQLGTPQKKTLTINSNDTDVWVYPVSIFVKGAGETPPTFTAGDLNAAVAAEQLDATTGPSSAPLVVRNYGTANVDLAFSGTVVAA